MGLIKEEKMLQMDFEEFLWANHVGKDIYVCLFDKKYENYADFKEADFFDNLDENHKQEVERFQDIFKNSNKLLFNFQGFEKSINSILKLND